MNNRGESFSLYANNDSLFDKLRLVVDYEDGLRNLERVATIVESADMPTLELNDSDTSTSEYEIDVEDYSTEFTRLSIRLNSVDHDGVLWPSQWHIWQEYNEEELKWIDIDQEGDSLDYLTIPVSDDVPGYRARLGYTDLAGNDYQFYVIPEISPRLCMSDSFKPQLVLRLIRSLRVLLIKLILEIYMRIRIG